MASFLTINDYFNKAGMHLQHNRISRQVVGKMPSKNSDFKQLLKGLSSDKNQSSDTVNGLGLSDYRKHAIKVRPTISLKETLTHTPEIEKNTATKTESEKNTPSISDTIDKNKLKIDPNSSTEMTNTQNTDKNSENGTSERQNIDSLIQKAADKYNLTPKLISAVIKAESDFNADVISRAGAQGLMQLMPETAKELGVTDPFDVEQNIEGGVRYLRQMMDQFKGNVRLALAAYNAGPGAVQRYQGIPPYQETIQYVQKVLKFSLQNL